MRIFSIASKTLGKVEGVFWKYAIYSRAILRNSGSAREKGEGYLSDLCRDGLVSSEQGNASPALRSAIRMARSTSLDAVYCGELQELRIRVAIQRSHVGYRGGCWGSPSRKTNRDTAAAPRSPCGGKERWVTLPFAPSPRRQIPLTIQPERLSAHVTSKGTLRCGQ
jgi:hypothetical protein